MPIKKFDNRMYVTIYELTKQGLRSNQIARKIGVDRTTLKMWRKKDPAVRDAFERGQQNDFARLYHHLPDHLKVIWNRINELDATPDGQKRIATLLMNEGKRTRQELFVHAWITSGFSLSEALRIVAIDLQTFQEWNQDVSN